MAGNAPHIPGCRDLSLIGERVARSLFSAISDRVGRPVTVTVFPPLGDGRTRAGFDRAAATAQRLGAHPSVITIHDWGHADDGRPWIVTEPQPTESVDTLLMLDGPLDVERAVQVGVLLVGALETAHRAGIVHGDLSPARLVFGNLGEPLLAETGLAEFAAFPGLGALNNPVRYHAPPEVLERTDISPATDVFSLATTVYALLAGRAPQQKPAEITDSNASLLLRILQMPVPRIERPDLPPGLEDVLRSAMSPSPDKRPQQAIEVAWLLQDVQRRAGYAVTEPVVLDLDEAGAPPDRGAHARAAGMPTAHPVPEVVPDVDVPPPTIFPFAEGLDTSPPGDAAPGGWPGTAAGPDRLWPSTPVPGPSDTLRPVTPATDPSPGGQTPPDTLWPSSWPADELPAETPPWAADPLADGSDGGSIGGLGHSAPPEVSPAGRPGGTAPPDPGLGDRPPELDELPSWYTDPLPNSGGPPTAGERSNGRGAHPASPPADPWASPDERLPGAGDELRSLFGEVVRDPADPGHPQARTGPLSPAAPERDPLGPPRERPPIDLSRLDAPLGPAPYLPPSARGRDEGAALAGRALTGGDGEAGTAAPARLPGRYEVEGRPPPNGHDDDGAATRAAVADRPARSERSAPRQVAPVPDRDEARQGAAAGPPALPVIVLIGVVIVLTIGAAWLVVTGDDSEQPPADRQDQAAAGAGDPAAAAPTGVQVTTVPEGVQVTWEGAADATYVVTVFSADRPPEVLEASAGTSVFVPNVDTGAGGRCFSVAAAPGATGEPGVSSLPACTPGASIEGMQGA